MNSLDYLKERYDDEQSRFKHFEEKCSKFLAFLTAVVGGISAWGAFSKDSLFVPVEPQEWIQLILFCVALFCAVCSWGHAILAIKIGACPVLPKSSAAILYIKNSDDEERTSYIFDSYINTLEKLSIVIDDKSINLEHAYNELIYSAWALGILGFITIIIEVTK
ncbi:hypothetical protein A6E09_18690 [Aliivibrio fischeri]|nr:hypothetical protein A6E09_18690 [Aliivibrio fischeri]